jgi:hypothetical protein
MRFKKVKPGILIITQVESRFVWRQVSITFLFFFLRFNRNGFYF